MSLLWDELQHWLEGRLASWAAANGTGALPAYTLEEPPGDIDADAACNLPLLLAKPLKKAPRAIAQDLQTFLDKDRPALLDAVTIAGAGFLNFRFSSSALEDELKAVLQHRSAYGRSAPKKERVLLEFVSANPTGPLHVGHGRGAALGDSLGLVLEHLGFTVSREYYINDAGNQVQLLAESVRARCLELAGKPAVLPEEGYHGDYVKDIARDYRDTHANGLDDLPGITAFSLQRMIKEIEKDLADFGIRFDTWFSEASVVQKGLVEKHIQTLKERGSVQEYEGAVWFVAPGEDTNKEKDKDRVLRRKDGRWTYFATDVAYHADKLERGFDRLIDIWGADHHGYVPRVKGSLAALGYDPERLHIVLYQLVSLTRGGVPVSMSKRSGDFITMREVLEEVGRDACRFFFAMRGPNTALEFDLELAKKHTEENPVYYLQYAHARICSIFKEAVKSNVLPPLWGKERMGGVEPVELPPTPTLPHKGGGGSDLNLSLLKEKEERALIKRLALFPQSLKVCAQVDSPHPLANYLLSLGRQFHFFYDHHRVLGVEPALTQARLALLDAVREVLRLGLKLLGVSAPESM